MKKYKFTDMKSMLKLLAFFCSLLLSSLANKTYSQSFTTPNNSFGTNSHRVAPDSTLYFPTGCGIPTDTLSLFSQGFNGKGEKKRMAAIYYDSCGHKQYTWDPASKTWHQSDGGGGGGGTVSTTNSVTGDGTGGTPIKLVNDAATPGNLKYYGTNSSGTKGYGDLSALIKNLGNSDLTATGNRVFNGAGNTLKFINLHNPQISFGDGSSYLYLIDSTNDNVLRIGNSHASGGGSKPAFNLDVGGVGSDLIGNSSSPYFSLIIDSGRVLLIDQFNNYIFMLPPSSVTPGLVFNGVNGTYFFTNVGTTSDTGTYKPLAYNTTSQDMKYLDHWPGGGSGNPFADNTALVKNNSDNTKKVIIGAANVSTATTRTLQAPDANGTIVLNDNTATLTNKTIAAGSNTITGINNSNLSGSAAITNANLANSSITINGVNTALGTSMSVTDATLSTSNVTTNNATTSKHGFLPILSNVVTQYLDGTGAWSTPPGTGLSVTAAPNTANYTVPTGRRVFFTLADLTGQANHNVVLGATTAGDEIIITNLNTSASTFNWTFTGGTVKDFGQNTVTTLTNLTVYHLVLISGSNYQIIN